MLGLTKTRRQASLWESGPSGKRRARLFAVHRYRKSGPRKTALTGLRKKKNDCRYIDDAGACTSRRRPAEEVCHPSKESGGGHGKDTERARRKQGKSTEKTRREQGGSKERARKEHGEDTERARREQGRARKGHGKGKEEARREQGGSTERHGKATKDRERVKRRPGAPQKSRLEGGGGTGWRGEVPIEVHEHKKTGALIGRRYVAR